MVITALIAGCGGGAFITPTSQDVPPPAGAGAPTPYPTYTLYPTYTPPAPLPETGTPQPGTVTILGIPSTIKVQVIRVIDGDTIEVQSTNGNRDTVRLLGVGTPETFRANKPNDNADPWLVGVAKLEGHTVVTNEKNKKQRIPRVCDKEGVKWKDLDKLIEAEGPED